MIAILQQIVESPQLHAKWLNTLSFMENMGARKISACEHPHTTDIIQLKHAAEEHRHAYYLKKQIEKVASDECQHYFLDDLLGKIHTRQYLQSLDILSSRYLKTHFSLSGNDLKYASYLFVTYAIEVRADELYPQYQEVLTKNKSKVMVKSIIMEEEGHLEEMISQLEKFHPEWKKHAKVIQKMEQNLFQEWFSAISKEVFAYASTANTPI